LSWRGKYVGWYRLLENDFSKLVPTLSDMDVMESVTPEDVLIIPTNEEEKPRNERKALPNLSLKLTDDSIEVRITYIDKESVDLLRNLLNDSQKKQLDKLLDELVRLDPSYETILYSKARQAPKPRLIRKYVTSRLDPHLIERIIDEDNRLRRGGRHPDSDSSTYLLPEAPEFVFVRQTVPLTTEEFIKVLHKLKPIYKLLSGVKSQREMISSRLSRPRHKRNLYREFIEVLNDVKGKDLISAEERRKLNDRWRKDEEGREELVDELKEILSSAIDK
jgi:hypothetical protein